jgi:Protein of unknown function (DUF1236)
MPIGRLWALVAAFLLSTSSLATADDLTDQQRKAIYDAIVKDKSSPSRPPAYNASKGSEVPASVQLNELPSAIDDPKLRGYHYSVSGKQVVVADPKTRKIISVIGE